MQNSAREGLFHLALCNSLPIIQEAPGFLYHSWANLVQRQNVAVVEHDLVGVVHVCDETENP